MDIYEIIRYDVWGNEKDGFEVNDAHHTGVFVSLTKDASDEQIIRALKNEGYISRNCRFTTFGVDHSFGDPPQAIYIEHAKSGAPFCELHLCD
jgi:hypothetical protein